MSKPTTARVTIGNRSADYPIVWKNNGDRDVIDLTGMRGAFTGAVDGKGLNAEVLQHGGSDTASCISAITHIDGVEGILEYRGYDIKDLAANSSYMEVAYLLLHELLPMSQEELDAFEADIVANSEIPEVIVNLIDGTDLDDVSTMDLLASAVGMLPNSMDDQYLIGKMMMINALMTRKQLGLSLDDAALDTDKGFTENYLAMCFGDEPTPAEIKAMDINFILHADHELNAGTAVVRNTASTKASTKAAICAGIGTLSGPLHGGANQAVLNQLGGIVRGDTELFKGQYVSDWGLEERVAFVIDRAKTKGDDFRLMGFGHRVYKNRDPRAMVMKSSVDEVLDNVRGATDEQRDMLTVARLLEETALGDEYFTSKGLYPNVDFYSGIMQKAMRYPDGQMTPNFAASRVVGWVAHKQEQDNDPLAKLNRPRHVNRSHTTREYPAMGDVGTRAVHAVPPPGEEFYMDFEDEAGGLLELEGHDEYLDSSHASTVAPRGGNAPRPPGE